MVTSVDVLPSLLATAIALLSIPGPVSRKRLRCEETSAGLRFPKWNSRAAQYIAVPASGLVGGVVLGVGGLCAAIALASVGVWCWNMRWQASVDRAHTAELVIGIRALTSELRAGSHPTLATENAAADAGPGIAALFREIAATARLGGDVAVLLEKRAATSHPLHRPLGRMGRAWALAQRHGIALADVLDAVRRDLEHRLAFTRDVETKMAGPRATAAVLAGLPVLGLLMGEVAGATPLSVLADQTLGQVLLVAGAGLLCGGVVWTLRLTQVVVRR